MASMVSGYIGRIDPGDGTEYALGSTAYGICETAAATAAKTVDMTGFTLFVGATVFVKFINANSASDPTLNVNGTGAKPMYQYGTTAMGTNTSTSWNAGAVVALTYDGTGWLRSYFLNSTNTVTSVWCNTAAGTAAKVSSNASYYALRTGNTFELTLRYANSYAGAITLNVSSTGAKPIYINGAASSASNYTLPAGKYMVLYDGTAYHFRTDGKLHASEASAAYLTISADTALNDTHAGKTLLVSANATLTVGTLSSGAEIEVWNTGTYTVKISGTLFKAGTGNASSCNVEKYSAAILKYMNSRLYVAGGIS